MSSFDVVISLALVLPKQKLALDISLDVPFTSLALESTTLKFVMFISNGFIGFDLSLLKLELQSVLKSIFSFLS